MSTYYYRNSRDQLVGPVNAETLRVMHQGGVIKGDMICPVGTQSWVKYVSYFKSATEKTSSSFPALMKIGTGFLLVLVAAGVVLGVATFVNVPLKPFGPVTNSRWDGSVDQVKEYLSRNAHDPSSLQYVTWGKVVSISDGYKVDVTLRAKNAFNAYRLHEATFYFDTSGAVTKVEGL